MRAAIIPARGGSKRIPRKNIREFYGKPIIAYSIQTALDSGLFEVVAVSTEDDEISEVAISHGASVIRRPPWLAEVDGAPDPGTQEVTRSALQKMLVYGLNLKYACCIYPCAPLLRINDLQIAFNDLKECGKPFVYMDGQFYWGRVMSFLDRIPLSRGWQQNTEYPDINTEADWKRVEEQYANRGVLAGK